MNSVINYFSNYFDTICAKQETENQFSNVLQNCFGQYKTRAYFNCCDGLVLTIGRLCTVNEINWHFNMHSFFLRIWGLRLVVGLSNSRTLLLPKVFNEFLIF